MGDITSKPIRVVYLAAASSIHVVKWVNSLIGRGVMIDLITLHRPNPSNPIDKRVNIHLLSIPPPFGYYFCTYQAKKIVTRLMPDIVHAIYAGGYGTLLRLINFHPSILSAIGSDIEITRVRSEWKYRMIKSNLNYPDLVTVNSKFLLSQAKKFMYNKKIKLILHGVDTKLFNIQFTNGNQSNTIGTVKTLEYGYGIDILIKAFESVSSSHSINLLIAGQGSLRKKLIHLTKKLGISNKVCFVGSIPHGEVPKILNKLSIFVCMSRIEGFGGSVIEASSCGLPVIVSNVGGLPETLIDGKTGFIVEKEDPVSAAKAIEKLINNPNLRSKMGQAGRAFVVKNYNWDDCVDKMIDVYNSLRIK